MEGVCAAVDVVGFGVDLAGEEKQLQRPWVRSGSFFSPFPFVAMRTPSQLFLLTSLEWEMAKVGKNMMVDLVANLG